MLYGEYRVISCGLTNEQASVSRLMYKCILIGFESSNTGHMTGFSLIIMGCVGEDAHLKQYEIIPPHIEIGDIFNCEFAWRMQSNGLVLCISGLRKQKENSFSGEWLRFPGLITCDGEALLKLYFPYPNHALSYLKTPKSGYLTWVQNPKPSFWRRIIPRFLSFS